jgi:hypothetical protein
MGIKRVLPITFARPGEKLRSPSCSHKSTRDAKVKTSKLRVETESRLNDRLIKSSEITSGIDQ